MIALLALAAAVLAEWMEKLNSDEVSSHSHSMRSRAAGFLIAIFGACLLQVYTMIIFNMSSVEIMCVAALLGAVIARIAVSDARSSIVPDGLCVPAFCLLVVWRWSVHQGAVPDPGTVAFLAALGVGIFLLALALFIILESYPIPPVDTLLFVLLLALPNGHAGVYSEAFIMSVFLVLRRVWPKFGVIFMSPEQIEKMRTDAATVFGDNASTSSDPHRYFPLAPFAVMAMAGAILITTLSAI